MVFSSLTFLCIFLPATYIIYTILPSLEIKNILLILVSLLFYAYGEPIYVLLMIGSACFNYLCARFIAKFPEKKKIFLIAGVGINLGILGVFKYISFFLSICTKLFGIQFSDPGIALPVGISFFTFQALSYVIDVYKGTVMVQKSFQKVLLYIAFFPQLIAGPIVKYKDISKEIDNRKQDPSEAALGMRRFICGLGKKVLIANTMGQVADQIFAAEYSQVNILVAWLGAISYLMQIYYDFSGYSDMAIGLGKMFGFHFKENFQYPYGADSIQDFWRKWHISLSSWFKEYLYIPLGGNRKGKVRTCTNKMIVFFCTGLWHGANWTFIVWGLYHGMFLLLEEYIPVLKKLPRVIAHIYTLLVVTIGFVIFRADTLFQGIFLIKQMFTGFSMSAISVSLFWQQLTPWFLFMLMIAVIGAAPVKVITDKLYLIINGNDKESVLFGNWIQRGLYLISLLLLCWCMVHLSGNSYNPFIYFRF